MVLVLLVLLVVLELEHVDGSACGYYPPCPALRAENFTPFMVFNHN